jgi:periplasmic protein TonB
MKKLIFVLLAFLKIFIVNAQKITEDDIVKKNYQEINPFEHLFVDFSIVERWAMYPNGKDGINDLILKNLQYPKEAQEQKLEGQVIVEYIITLDGTVNEIKVIKSVHPLLDEEAKRVINLMERWVPTIQKGRAIKTAYQQIINFQL